MELLLAILYFSTLTFAFLWKLIGAWSSSIPGGLEDTRLFLWNAWWFHHAISVLHTNPYSTAMLFHPFGASLVSHDFPLWTNLITFLGQEAGGSMIASSNLWFALSWMLLGFCVYGLSYEVTGMPAASLAAGTLAMTHSYTLARAMQNWGQFNSYAIALFLWMVVRARRSPTRFSFAVAGVALAWTAACHYYFLIYCVVSVLGVAIYDLCPYSVHFSHQPGAGRVGQKSLLGLALAAGLFACAILIHPTTLHWMGWSIGLHGPENALFVMWILLAVWAGSFWSLTLSARSLNTAWRRERLLNFGILLGVAAMGLSPLFWGTFNLIRAGGYPKQSILWKTHLAGANLLALVGPNPLQAVWGPVVSAWYLHRGMNPQEQAAAIGRVCLAVLVVSRVWRSNESARHWLALAIGGSMMAMGTHLHIAQYNFWCPLPFFGFRLLPVLGNVRVPERWMALGAIAWSVVLAQALVSLAAERGWSLRRLSGVIVALILLENWPGIPIRRAPAVIPIYNHLRTLPEGAVLSIPLYIGDSSIGTGNAIEHHFIFPWDQLWAQTIYEKPTIGGYVGRLSRRIIDTYKADPFIHRLLDLEEGKALDQDPEPAFGAYAVAELKFRYVIIYSECTTPAVVDYVRKSLSLTPLETNGPVQLYEVRAGRSD